MGRSSGVACEFHRVNPTARGPHVFVDYLETIFPVWRWPVVHPNDPVHLASVSSVHFFSGIRSHEIRQAHCDVITTETMASISMRWLRSRRSHRSHTRLLSLPSKMARYASCTRRSARSWRSRAWPWSAYPRQRRCTNAKKAPALLCGWSRLSSHDVRRSETTLPVLLAAGRRA
jgi:hypothetical protein